MAKLKDIPRSNVSLVIPVLFLLSCAICVNASSPAGKRAYCPRSGRIKITVPGHNDNVNAPLKNTMTGLHETLKACSNIKALDLWVTLMGCSEWPDRWNFPFDINGHDKYPSMLEELSVEGYSFGDKEWVEVQPPRSIEWWPHYWFGNGNAWRWFKGNFASGSQREKTNLELWVDAMDFSRIHTLTLRDYRDNGPLLTKHLAPRLPALRNLTVEGEPMHDFIMALPTASLRRLSWLSPRHGNNSFEAVLERHGPALEELEWRSPETLSRARPVLSVDQLRRLGEQAPNLHTLTVDLNRNGTWPWDELQALAHELPTLSNLSLYLEMASECRRQKESQYSSSYEIEQSGIMGVAECDGADQFAKPLLNHSTAVELFNSLRAEKIGEELLRVGFYAGDWTPPWLGPLYIPDWLDGRQAKMECSVLHTNGSRKADWEPLCEGWDTRIR